MNATQTMSKNFDVFLNSKSKKLKIVKKQALRLERPIKIRNASRGTEKRFSALWNQNHQTKTHTNKPKYQLWPLNNQNYFSKTLC